MDITTTLPINPTTIATDTASTSTSNNATTATSSTNGKFPSVEGRDPAYFSYYAMLQHQQNMLQDTVRTSTYRSAILINGPACFQNKLILDVGAGSGILSYFAVQAGASKVYAIEASQMAEKMKKIIDVANSSDLNSLGKNSFLKNKVEVIQVDTIISEPIGVLLIHERMLESYLYARDHYLKPGGSLFPSSGTIHLAPFTDAALWSETMGKARFWEQQSFYGVDLSSLYSDAKDEMFVTLEELQDLTIPFYWQASYTGIIHGIAGWFDLYFTPPPFVIPQSGQIFMSTSPTSERTHWQQVRFLLKEPLAVNAGQTIQGWMRCVVNDMRSYTIEIEILAGDGGVDLDVTVLVGDNTAATINTSTASNTNNNSHVEGNNNFVDGSFII
ncbi:1567_t:CDS:2 [Entrophospora sp. SA101]|nr:1567_t:CDS:2 [Entrophospora sp. SA101]